MKKIFQEKLVQILTGAECNIHNITHIFKVYSMVISLLYDLVFEAGESKTKAFLNECNRSWFPWKERNWRVRAIIIEAASQMNSATILWLLESLLRPLKIFFDVLEKTLLNL